MHKKTRNNGLVLGFSVSLALMALLMVVGLSSMSSIQERLQVIVTNHNEKTDLINVMRYAARERTVSLHRMLLIEDAFERDDEFMKFNKFALVFFQARNKMRTLPLSGLEKQALEKQGELTAAAVELQIAKLKEPALTGSAMVLRALEDHQGCFYHFAQDCADRTREDFLARPLSAERQAELTALAIQSLADQEAIERLPQMPFPDYLAAYFAN